MVKWEVDIDRWKMTEEAVDLLRARRRTRRMSVGGEQARTGLMSIWREG